MAKQLKIDINDPNVLKDLLQEAYVHANEQILQAQNEINKLANATNLQDEPIDGKSKYAKAINDYLGMKDKAISKKIEISKILSEVYKHNGDLSNSNGDASSEAMNFDFSDIKKLVDESMNEKEKTKTKVIDLKKA